MKNIFLLLLVFGFFSSCSNNKQSENKNEKLAQQKTPTNEKETFETRDTIFAVAHQVLMAFKDKNYNELVKYISEDGVRFSPYAFIDTLNSKKLSREDLISAVGKKWILTWGSYDGTGDPIRLSVNAYVDKFVYSAEYLEAEATSFDAVMKQGNSKNNIKEIFPKHHYVEYHFSGFDQKLNGMDWSSLRLVFAKQNGEYFLVAVVHDQWTV